MKFVIADPKNGRCYQIEQDDTKSRPFYGMKIGQEVEGSLVGLTGCKLVITGGSDKQGFPMRKDVHGTERRNALLGSGTGFRSKKKGERKRKTVRGGTVSEQIAQLNLKVTAQGQKTVAALLGKEEKTETPKEEKESKLTSADKLEKEAKKKEEKPEEETKREKPKAQKSGEAKKAEEKPAGEKK